MKKRKKDKFRHTTLFLVCILCVLLAFFLGYLLAMWGILEVANSIQIENLVIELNESKIVDAAYRKLEMQGRI